MPNSSRPFIVFLLAALLVSPSSFALNSPLSDEAIREAYFLGQRHDLATSNFLEKYRQRLDEPETGPYIASVEFLTPFARMVSLSSEHSIGYSAQQAEQEHRGQEESVTINIEVLFTASYGPLISRPTDSRSGSPVGFAFRSSDFWRDIDVQVTTEDKALKPLRFNGEPTYVCVEHGCRLTGATLHLQFPARLFASAATVQVKPPEGPEVLVDFDLSTLR